MKELEQFLTSRHDVCERTKTSYRLAFNFLGKFTENPCSLNRQGLNMALSQMTEKLKPGSWNSYVMCIRRFYLWKGLTDSVKDVKFKRIRRLDYVAKKILSPHEVRALLRGACHPRDRALLAAGVATGARRGELMTLRLRDVEAYPYGFRLQVCGKTGTHKTPPIVGEFAKIFRVWLEHHPQRDNPDAPLWPRLRSGHWGMQQEPIRKSEFHLIIKKAAQNAGLSRNVHWHMLRHTENTWSTKSGVSRATRNITHGWSQEGNTAAIYESLTDSDAEGEYLRMHGLAKPEQQTSGFESVKCAYCGEENPSINKYCHFCGVSLTGEDARTVDLAELRKTLEKIDKRVDELERKK